MDADVVIRSEKQLQRNLRCLSKGMTGFLVQRMSSCLCRSRTITEYEAQVVTSQNTDVGKASKLMEIVIRKGRRACTSFLSCLGICDPKLYESVTGHPAPFSHKDHHHSEDIPSSEKQASFPTCIINIHNSSVQHCIFGNNNRQCITCDQHSLLSQNDAINVDEMEDSQSHDQLIPAPDPVSQNEIHMERSQIEYVIIGDHNSMTVTETLNSEDEEDTEIEPEPLIA
ncbi:uncharacterized protein si:dkey-29h14.10 [Triplophysa dalaica]|uniref:uncharacterized protein si:dkey-29h14.10 n=1 Tax=Triplophysa dalaica TaxID=1582913 RepID=UPI0024DF83BC|nr:uncharacterized protein si:dkey-29h14.10 [Triplophysa dalaica]